jgi:CspA family cold shock protein
VKAALAFGHDCAQHALAIYVLACLSYLPGSRACDSRHHCDQVVRFRARFAREFYTFGGQNMAIGTVKFFNSAKGFGFIAPESGEKDVFVHISAVEHAGLGTLSEGQRISYEVVTERGKLAASDLKAA